jgi:Protein of unknown function (DUF3604)
VTSGNRKVTAMRVLLKSTVARTLLFSPGVVSAQAVDHAAEEAAVPENPLKEAYFGETDDHTAFSLDAYIGGARLTPFDVVSVNAFNHSIVRPSDFAAVSVHAEFMGEMLSTQVPGAPIVQQERRYTSPIGYELRG